MLLSESTLADADVELPVVESSASIPEQPTLDAATLDGILLEAEIPFLRRIVRRWHRDTTDADDLVQDTLMRALASAHRWQPGSNLRAWLVTIMRNQFLETASRVRRSRVAIEFLDPSDVCTPDNTEMRLLLRDVKRAINRLPEKQRSAVLFAAIEERSYADAACMMGLSADAVRSHLARARDRLRRSVYRTEQPNWASQC